MCSTQGSVHDVMNVQQMCSTQGSVHGVINVLYARQCTRCDECATNKDVHHTMLCRKDSTRAPTSCPERRQRNLCRDWPSCVLPAHRTLGALAWPYHTLGMLQQEGCKIMSVYTDIKHSQHTYQCLSCSISNVHGLECLSGGQHVQTTPRAAKNFCIPR